MPDQTTPADALARLNRHYWAAHDGAAHCWLCGSTLNSGQPLPEDGCVSLPEKLRLIANHPGRWARTTIQAVLVEAADALSPPQPPADAPPACTCGFDAMLEAQQGGEYDGPTNHARDCAVRVNDPTDDYVDAPPATETSGHLSAASDEQVARWQREASSAPEPGATPEAGTALAVTGDTSDGYHTFDELYAYRKAFNALLFNEWAAQGRYDVHKSWRHSDGEPCFGGGWFVVVAQTPEGQISNHYKAEDWSLFNVPERERGAEYDGHTPQDALDRMLRLAALCQAQAEEM